MDSPFDREGKWFTVRTVSGHEGIAQKNIEARIRSLNLESKIFEAVIPMHDVAEVRSGKRVVRSKKTFPGYILVRCHMDDETWSAIRNTPDITGFVGSGDKPIALRRKEIEQFLMNENETNEIDAVDIKFKENDSVTVKNGPFEGHNGFITNVNPKTLKLKVTVNLFGRDVPVELDVSQVAPL